MKTTSFPYQCKTASIEHDTALDGYYVVRTSEPALRPDTASVVRGHKNLVRLERGFRSLKTVDLRIRPIYHRTEPRVRAHIFLCMLAYYVEWRLQPAPLLFHDEDLDLQLSTRDPVLPAQARDTAKARKSRHQTDGSLRLHSMSTLLAELATQRRCACRLQTYPNGPPIERLTEPTLLQRRAVELIKAFPVPSMPISWLFLIFQLDTFLLAGNFSSIIKKGINVGEAVIDSVRNILIREPPDGPSRALSDVLPVPVRLIFLIVRVIAARIDFYDQFLTCDNVNESKVKVEWNCLVF